MRTCTCISCNFKNCYPDPKERKMMEERFGYFRQFYFQERCLCKERVPMSPWQLLTLTAIGAWAVIRFLEWACASS